MGTTQSLFYAYTDTVDPSFGTSVRRFQETNPNTVNNTTTLVFQNTGANQTRRAHPFANQNANNPITADYGWSWDRTGAEGMDSVSGALRVVESGNWTLSAVLIFTAPALLASYTVALACSLYRVSSSDIRTLISGPHVGAAFTVSSAGSNQRTVVFNPGEIILDPNERLLIAVGVNSSATTAALTGGTTNSTINIQTGVANGLRIQLPGQGFRTLFERDTSELAPSDVLGDPVRVVEYMRNPPETASGSDTTVRYFEGARSILNSAPAIEDPSRRTTQYRRPADEFAPGAEMGAPIRVYQGYRNLPEFGGGEDSPTRIYIGVRQLMELAPLTDEAARRTTQYRRLDDELAPAIEAGAPVRVYQGYRSLPENAPAEITNERVFEGSRIIGEDAPANESPTRQGVFYRSHTEQAGSDGVDVVRVYQGYRDIINDAPALEAPERVFIGSRTIMENAPALDYVTRRGEFNRLTSELASADHDVQRIVSFIRATNNDAPADDTATRIYMGSRNIMNSAAAVDYVGRIITYGRNITEGPADVINFPGFKYLTGIAYDPDGVPLEGVEVWLIRLSDDRHIRTTFTDVNGVWEFERDLFDNQSYMVYGYTDIGGVEHADVSERDLTVVDVGSITPGSNLNGINPNLYLVPQGLGSGGSIIVQNFYPIFDD